MWTALAVALVMVTLASAEISFVDKFDKFEGWVQSKFKSDYGKVAHKAPVKAIDAEEQKGLKLTEDARFYAVSKKFPTPISNDGKHFVVSFSLKNEQRMQCGGGYIKIASEMDQEKFNGDSDYWLMFGPDRCGSTNRVHIIFNFEGKNLLWKETPKGFTDDHLTHFYTLDVAPDNTYEYYLDGKMVSSGKLEDDWEFLAPKTIPDPNEKKPADWVDIPQIDDPEDKKPDHWDDEPATIVDPEAAKPEDWDDEEDGEWEAPMIPNPKYQGEWKPRRIPNPAYKGPWKAKEIPNPDYKPNDSLYKAPGPLNYVGIDVWQVESGSIFDNIMIGDDLDEILKKVDDVFGKIAEGEKEQMAEEEAAADAAAAAEAEHDHDHGHGHADTPEEADDEGDL